MKEAHREVIIDSLACGGRGVGRLDGKAVFVPLTAPGDRVRFRPMKEKKGYIEGEFGEVTAPSPLRREPPCPAYGECGGCDWQHLPYGEQARWKESIFRETLWRLGTVPDSAFLPIIPAPSEWHYRNRAQFKVRFADGKLYAGFYRRKSHYVIDIESCPLMSPLINAIIGQLKSTLANAPFRERMPQIDLSVNDGDDRAVAILHLIAPPSGSDIAFAKKALHSIEGLAGLFFQSGRKDTLTAVFSSEESLLQYRLPSEGGEMTLSFSPGGFTQVNYRQNRRLVSEVMAVAREKRPARVLDLYSGMGNFSLPLSRVAGEVTAVEEYAGATEDGRRNTGAAGIENCRFVSGDAVREMEKLNPDRLDLILVDPPREGAATVMKRLAESAVPVIVYVSCNPATLARDLRYLSRGGYRIVSSRPVDLFPQTHHIESITVAVRQR